MWFLKSLGIIVFSLMLVIAASTAITWYNLKDVLDKQNLKGFILAEVVPDVINMQCNQFCIEYNATDCMELCISQASNETGINIMVDDTVNSIYSKEYRSVSLDKVVYYMNMMFLPLIMIAIMSAVFLVALTEAPFKALGHSFIVIAIGSFIAGLLPQIIPFFIPALQIEGIMQKIFGYISTGFYRELYFGIGFLIVGIVCYAINRSREEREGKFEDIRIGKLKKMK